MRQRAAADPFTAAISRFARGHADQDERDHAPLARAAASGDIESMDG
jgi:hypothetical protein